MNRATRNGRFLRNFPASLPAQIDNTLSVNPYNIRQTPTCKKFHKNNSKEMRSLHIITGFRKDTCNYSTVTKTTFTIGKAVEDLRS